MRRQLKVCSGTGLVMMVGLVVISLLAGGWQAAASPQLFSHIVVFGDSLSDTGNFYELSEGVPPPPYADGRFCNGPIWVEYLADRLHTDYQAEDNYAVGGATTARLNTNNGMNDKVYPGLQDEVDTFESKPALPEPGRALFIVGAGANDFFIALETGTEPEELIATGVKNTTDAVLRLYMNGARNIMVMNVPNLGVTPLAVGMGMEASLTQLAALYNQYLNQALDQLASSGLPTIRLDAFAVLTRMATQPQAFGIADVTTPCLYLMPEEDTQDYLFWDSVHPTTLAHAELAKEAVKQLAGHKARGVYQANSQRGVSQIFAPGFK